MLTRYRRRAKSHPFHYTKIPGVDITPQYDIPTYEYSSEKIEEFHKAPHKIRIAFGGNRAGKSEAGGFETVDMARQFPGMTFWACSITQDFVKVTASKIFKYLAPEEIEKIAWANSAKRIPSLIRLHNGSEIEFKTYKSGIEAFAGASVKGIWLDEDPALGSSDGEAIFVECLQRTIDCQGRIWLTGTPILGKNWMYRRLFQKGIETSKDRKPNRNIECWTVSLLENKFVPQEEKDLAKENLTADEIDRRFYGLFTTLSGAVFKEFREDVHVLKEEPIISASWRRIRAIDLGYENPFCCLWIAQDEDGCLWVYDEYYQAQKLISYHAAEIERITQSHNDMMTHVDGSFRVIESTVCDHERQTRAELESCGIFTVPAHKDVDFGIQVVNRRFMIDGNQHTRIYISPRCRNLIRQMGNYHYKSVPDGRENKEVIDKVDDHAVDPLRYGVVYFETGSGGYHSITA